MPFSLCFGRRSVETPKDPIELQPKTYETAHTIPERQAYRQLTYWGRSGGCERGNHGPQGQGAEAKDRGDGDRGRSYPQKAARMPKHDGSKSRSPESSSSRAGQLLLRQGQQAQGGGDPPQGRYNIFEPSQGLTGVSNHSIKLKTKAEILSQGKFSGTKLPKESRGARNARARTKDSRTATLLNPRYRSYGQGLMPSVDDRISSSASNGLAERTTSLRSTPEFSLRPRASKMHGGRASVAGQRELRPSNLPTGSTIEGNGVRISERGWPHKARVHYADEDSDGDERALPNIEPIPFMPAIHPQSLQYLPSACIECRSSNGSPAFGGRRSRCGNEDCVFHVIYGTAGSSV